MKKVFTRLLILGIVSFAVYSCDNGNADITLLNSAPDVTLTNAPAGVVSGTDVKVAVEVTDGAFESSSISPISSVSYTLTDTTTSAEVLTGTVTGSGRAVRDTITIATGGLDLGVYELDVIAVDTEGLSQSAQVLFEVVENFSVGLLGTATAGGFDVDIDMERDESNLDLWKLSAVPLTAGEAKFRKNDAWDISWGSTDYPVGVAVVNTFDNIPIPADGDYEVTFNSETLEYSFKQLTGDIPTPIGIIGSSTPGGWGTDTDMQQVEGTTDEWILTVDLTQSTDPGAEGAKFRKDNAWTVNWGGSDFPSGIATQDGPNIQIPETGTYIVTFNSTTGAYNFQLQ